MQFNLRWIEKIGNSLTYWEQVDIGKTEKTVRLSMRFTILWGLIVIPSGEVRSQNNKTVLTIENSKRFGVQFPGASEHYKLN